MMMKRQAMALMMAAALALPSLAAPALAHRGYYDDYYRYDRYRDQGSYARKAVLGAGGGAAIGAIFSRDGRRTNGAVKGALLGAGAGLGYEYLRRRGYLDNRW